MSYVILSTFCGACADVCHAGLRDWCSQVNGAARSIGVSSTGLPLEQQFRAVLVRCRGRGCQWTCGSIAPRSRSGHAANQSVVSSDSAAEISFRERIASCSSQTSLVAKTAKGSCQRMSLRDFQSRNYLKAGLPQCKHRREAVDPEGPQSLQ